MPHTPLDLLDPAGQPLQGQPLALNAPQQPQIGSPLDALPEERASGFRNFVERIGLTGPSLLNSLSLAFGQSTREIENRRRIKRRQSIEDQIFERQAQDFLANRRQGALVEDVGGFKRFSGSGERAFPGAQAPATGPLSTFGKIEQDIRNKLVTREQVNAAGGGSAFAEKVTALEKTGIPHGIAVGLQAGRFAVTRDPQTNVAQVVDKSNGNIVFDGTQITPQAVPQPTPGPEIGLGRFPNVGETLGAGGVAKTAVNKIADLFGGDLPFQETSEAAAQLSNLNIEAVQLMRFGLGGKLNVQLQEKIEALLVKPNEIFGGEQEAKNKFASIIETLDTESQRLEAQIQRGGLRPETLDEARQKISELRTLSGKFKGVLSSQEPQDKGDIRRFFR